MASSPRDLRHLKKRLGGIRAHLAAEEAVRRGELAPEALERGLDRAESEGLPLESILPAAASGPPGPSAPPLPPEAREAAGDPARRIGRYVLVAEAGRGGMGVVHRAWQEDLGRWVALKRLRPEAVGGALDRFTREARAAAKVAHPGLVPVYDVGVHDGTPFLVMAWMEGGTLDRRTLAPRDAAAAVREAALAAEELHLQGIVHRDIKPANLLRDAQGRTCLGDFGLALDRDSDIARTASGQFLGTLPFAAPEQVRGQRDRVGPWSDVYSLGATLYALLCGSPPFEGRDLLDLADRVVNRQPAPIGSRARGCPPDLARICARAMAKRPGDRYPSARELAADLGRFLEGSPVSAPGGQRVHAWQIVAGLVLAGGMILSSRLLSPGPAVPVTSSTPAANSLVKARDLLRGGEPDVLAAHALLREVLRTAEPRVAAECWLLLGDLDRAGRLLADLPEARDLRGAWAFDTAAWDLGCAAPVPREDLRKRIDIAREALAPSRLPDALRALADGKPDEARRLAEAAIESGTPDTRAEVVLGMAKLSAGDAAAAESDFSQVIRHSAAAAIAWYGRGAARERQRRFREAADDFDRTFALRPSFPMALRNRARALCRAEDLAGAIETLERGRRAAPADLGLASDLPPLLLEAGRAGEADRLADELVRLHPGAPDAHLARALLRQRREDWEAALEDYEAALRTDPRHGPSLAGRGELRVRGDRFAEAIEDLDAAISAPGQRGNLAYLLPWRAKAHAGLGRWDLAWADYDAVLALKPGDPDQLFNRGVCALNAGRPGEALTDLEESVRLKPSLDPKARPLIERLRRGR